MQCMPTISIQKFYPHEDLKNYISEYYFIKNQTISHDTIPPLGFPVVQFHLQSNIQTYYANYKFPIDNVMIVGQLSKYAKIQQTNNTSLIGVNLKPTVLYTLTGMNACNFTDKGIPAFQFWGEAVNRVQQQLAAAITDEAKVDILNNFFIQLTHNKTLSTQKLDFLLSTILQKQGNITQNEINKLFPSTERTIQRHFNQHVGVSLKTYIRIVRNLNLFDKLQTSPTQKFSEIIHDLGYFDYSHFTKDFKLMTGLTPKTYFSNHEHFVQLLTEL